MGKAIVQVNEPRKSPVKFRSLSHGHANPIAGRRVGVIPSGGPGNVVSSGRSSIRRRGRGP
eukprot:2916997-Alexandrium_andersonii.AAC.1